MIIRSAIHSTHWFECHSKWCASQGQDVAVLRGNWKEARPVTWNEQNNQQSITVYCKSRIQEKKVAGTLNDSAKAGCHIGFSILFYPLFSQKLSVSVSYKVVSYMWDSNVPRNFFTLILCSLNFAVSQWMKRKFQISFHCLERAPLLDLRHKSLQVLT